MANPIDIIVPDPKEAELLQKAEFCNEPLSEELLQSLKTKSNFVLLSNAEVDFGGPDSSAVFVKYSTEPADPDVSGVIVEDPNASQLALYLRVSGEKLNDELFYLILQNYRSYLRASGIMSKGADGEIWIRVSKKSPIAGEKALLRLALLLSTRLKQEFPEITSVCALFIRGDGESFKAVKKASSTYFKKAEALKAKVWEDRGFNFTECHVLGHCGKCADKKLCANVRRIGRLTDKQRES